MIKVCRRHNLSTESCKELQQNQETNTRKPFYVERIPFTVNHSSIISIDEFQIDVGACVLCQLSDRMRDLF